MTTTRDPISTADRTDAAPGEQLTVRAPATGASLGTVDLHGPETLAQDLDRAREALAVWPRTRLADRQHVVHTFVGAAREELDDLSRLLAGEIGISRAEALAELEEALALVHDAVGESSAFYGHTYPAGAETITASFLQYTVHEPLGVIGVLMDAREPALSLARQVVPSLLVGDVLVVAVPQRAPLTVLRLVRLLHESGVPAEALQARTGDDAHRAALAQDGRLDGLSVHGTSEEAVSATAAARSHLTRVVAFGDSNDALLVLEDADLALVVDEAVRAGFARAGQGRTAVKRLIVHTEVLEPLTVLLEERVRGLRLGDPEQDGADVGPVLDLEQADEVRAQIAALVDAGAELIAGGGGEGTLVSPTVLLARGDAVDLATRTVIRGPVLVLLGTESLEAGTDLVDASPYGIGVGIFTRDVQRAGEAIQRLEIGTAVVNGAGDHRTRRTPFTGVRRSGVGVESLLDTPLATTELKTILAADIYDYVAENHDNPVGRHS